MSKTLYRVTFIRQDSGEEYEHYVLASGMAKIEDEYADIIKVEPLAYEQLTEGELKS